MMRPDDSPGEDSDQAVNVRPYNEHASDKQDDDVYETNQHDGFRENDNDNDNDYSDDDDDDDEPDEEAGVTG